MFIKVFDQVKILFKLSVSIGLIVIGINVFAGYLWETHPQIQINMVQFPNQKLDLLQRWLHIKTHLKKDQSQKYESEQAYEPLQQLYLGLSTLRDDIDMQRIRQRYPNSLSLSGSGGNFRALYYILSSILQDSDLQVEHVILTFHPLWMSDWDPKVDMSARWTNEYGQIQFWKDHLYSYLWLMRRKHALSLWIDQILQQIQSLMYSAKTIQKDDRFSTLPWFKSPSKLSQMEQISSTHKNKMLEQQWQRWTAMGKFNPQSSFQDQQKNKQAFQSLIQKLSQHTKHLTLIALPESKKLRVATQIPAWSMINQLINDIKSHQSPSLKINLIDMRDAIADDLFYDAVHLSKQGRTIFTQQLAQKLWR